MMLNEAVDRIYSTYLDPDSDPDLIALFLVCYVLRSLIQQESATFEGVMESAGVFYQACGLPTQEKICEFYGPVIMGYDFPEDEIRKILPYVNTESD